MEIHELLCELKTEIVILKSEIINLKREIHNLELPKPVSEHFIQRSSVSAFFEYGNTQMADLVKEEALVVSQIGRRQFFLRDSIEKLLIENIRPPK